MENILGLTSSKTFNDNSYHNRNFRRRVFHDNPTGTAPLTGLLSLTETEAVESPDFGWWEKRFSEPKGNLGSGITFLNADGSDGADPFNLGAPDGQGGSGTVFQILCVAGISKEFRARHVIQIQNVAMENGSRKTIEAVVDQVIDDTHLLLRYIGDVDYVIANTASDNDNRKIVAIGNANAEGTTSTSGLFRPPLRVHNFTQIFRNAFSFTRTSGKIPTDFDKTGIYKEKAKDNALDHMTEMEKAFIFGVRAITYVDDDGEIVPERTTGGVIWFLREWEKENSPYRGDGSPAATDNDNDDKRIIDCSGGITEDQFNGFLERAFRVTNNKAFEKLFLCGSGFLAAIANYVNSTSRVQVNKDMRAETVYGFNILTWETPFGTVHFKTHPLFSRNTAWRNNGLLVDVQNLRYRPLTESDTTLLKNRQKTDQDRRKDEWLTESGLECRFPESHMYLHDLYQITTA